MSSLLFECVLLHMDLKWIRRSLKCIYWAIYFWYSHKTAITWLFSSTHLQSLLSVNPIPLSVGFEGFRHNNKYVNSKGSLSILLLVSCRSLLQPAVKPGKVFVLQTLSCLLKAILLNLERSSSPCHKKGLARCQLYLLIKAKQGWANIRQWQERFLSEYLIQTTWLFPLMLFNQLLQNWCGYVLKCTI